jgi:hypothetical protein
MKPIQLSNTTELNQLQDMLQLNGSGGENSGNTPVMIFMLGHQPPECLTRVGAICQVQPIFFQRHLEYRWSSRPLNLFSSTYLPSCSFNIIRLRIVTIGDRGENISSGSHSHIQSMRERCEADMSSYLHDVTREYQLQAGNSIVREFNVHDGRYFSLEQEVTVMVKKLPNSWLGEQPYIRRYGIPLTTYRFGLDRHR